MTTGCAQVLDWYDCMEKLYDYSDELYEWLGDTYVSVITPQGDINLCAKINTPLYTVWREEMFSSICVTSGGTCTSKFYDKLVDDVSYNNSPSYVLPVTNRDLSGPFLYDTWANGISYPNIWNVLASWMSGRFQSPFWCLTWEDFHFLVAGGLWQLWCVW